MFKPDAGIMRAYLKNMRSGMNQWMSVVSEQTLEGPIDHPQYTTPVQCRSQTSSTLNHPNLSSGKACARVWWLSDDDGLR